MRKVPSLLVDRRALATRSAQGQASPPANACGEQRGARRQAPSSTYAGKSARTVFPWSLYLYTP